MDCFTCRKAAVGACRFCGRGVCENHLTERPFILDVFDRDDTPHTLVVEDALRCQHCHPRADPVAIPELG